MYSFWMFLRKISLRMIFEQAAWWHSSLADLNLKLRRKKIRLLLNVVRRSESNTGRFAPSCFSVVSSVSIVSGGPIGPTILTILTFNQIA